MEKRYSAQDVTIEQITTETDRLWQHLRTDAGLRRSTERAGINLAEIDPLARPDVIQIRSEGPGLDPATTAVVVAFAPVAAKVVADLWEHVILPRIIECFGQESLARQEES